MQAVDITICFSQSSRVLRGQQPPSLWCGMTSLLVSLALRGFAAFQTFSIKIERDPGKPWLRQHTAVGHGFFLLPSSKASSQVSGKKKN